MEEGYCVKCKARKPIANAVEETMKNGRKAIKGTCPTCGVVMFKILGSKGSISSPDQKKEPAPTPRTGPAKETAASASNTPASESGKA